MRSDFIAFILTHGRPDRVHTYKSLMKAGYTGRVVILIDNEDKRQKEYRETFGDLVHVFDKKAISETFDEADNFGDRRAIIYARNACFGIARELGAKYFIQLDDDYTDFRYKTDAEGRYGDLLRLRQIDGILEAMVDLLEVSGALTVAMAQNGDFIGGEDGTRARTLKPWRKAMNTFVCSVDRPFQFIGRINEDVNTYTTLGHRGQLFLTVPNVAINQVKTQSNAGGMTELYLDSGTYVKSFYTVMMCPSAVKIAEIGTLYRRIHHQVQWKRAVPCILDENHRKPRESTKA